MSTWASDDLFAISGLSCSYDGLSVLSNICLSLREGTVTAVLGNNGAGKSTLLNAVMGLIPMREGRVLFQGRDLAGMTTEKRVSLGVSLVPEGRRVFPQLTIRENLYMGAYLCQGKGEREALLQKMLQWFPFLGVRDKQLAGTLSGGEQQILAIARALMSQPKLLLLDEPSLGLSPKWLAQVYETIESIRESGVSVLLVEQNVQKAMGIASYFYVLNQGQLAFEGEDVRGHLEDLYLGRLKA